MQLQSVLNSIKNGMFAPVYLIYGDEEYLQTQLINNLRANVIRGDMADFNLDIIDGEKASLIQVVDSANTLPVFSEKRLVLVYNPPYFQTKKKDKEKDTKNSSEQALVNYLEDPLLSTCLVFWVKGSIDKRKKIVKLVGNKGKVIELNILKGNNLNNWIRNEVLSYDKKIEPKALEYIIVNSDHSLRLLHNELEKMLLYIGEEEIITLNVAEKMLTITSEANIFVLVDKMGQKKKEEVLIELRNLLGKGEPPVRVLFMIARQYRLMLLAKDLQNRGYTEQQIASELSIHPFVANKVLQQTRNVSFQELERNIRLLLEGDVALKTSSQTRSILEGLVIGLMS